MVISQYFSSINYQSPFHGALCFMHEVCQVGRVCAPKSSESTDKFHSIRFFEDASPDAVGFYLRKHTWSSWNLADWFIIRSKITASLFLDILSFIGRAEVVSSVTCSLICVQSLERLCSQWQGLFCEWNLGHLITVTKSFNSYSKYCWKLLTGVTIFKCISLCLQNCTWSNFDWSAFC